MQILLVEAILSGLFKNVDSSILSEGLAMVSSLIRDFSSAGHKVKTVVCKDFLRLSRFLKPSNVIKVDIVSFHELQKLAKHSDLTYVIAPESGGLLASLLEELNGFHICSDHEIVRRISDKAVAISEFSKIGVKTPKTLIYTPGVPVDLDDLKPPFVVKPKTGTGCEGLNVFKSISSLKHFLLKKEQELIIQEFIRGTPASISLITNGLKVVPISLNRQFISISKSMYLGGYTPMSHRLSKKALEVATKVVELFKGLRGYIGVDVVLSKDEVYVMEINPRLTVSYIGLSRCLSENLSDVIINAGLGKTYEFTPTFKAVCYFRKTLFEVSPSKLFKLSAFLDCIASPPIPIRQTKAYGFIAVASDSFTSARAKYFSLIEEIKRQTGCRILW